MSNCITATTAPESASVAKALTPRPVPCTAGHRKTLAHWSESKIVSRGGRTGNGWGAHECPHVVYVDGYYYLFRTQRYGRDNVSHVYRSKDPLDFGINTDEGYFVCTLPVAAPELIHHDNQWFIAALNPGLDGIRICRLEWIAETD